jgi:uncharacterized protein (DUF1800 family)
MSDRDSIAWLARRVGFGLGPGQLDALTAAGLATTLDRWLDPDAHGVAANPDPWAHVDIAPKPKLGITQAQAVVMGWLAAMLATPRPVEEWMRWFWHGHFVSTLRVVHSPLLMVNQLRMFGQLGLGDFHSLLRAVTVDPAMLVYLNGNTSSAGQINENYGREVLELFALGIGNYSEADVRAGATALTGWVVGRDATAQFVLRRHDDGAQRYLGRDGVHDVDTVVDAIVEHPKCAPFVTAKLARAILGPAVDPKLVASLAKDFAASGLQLRPLLRAIVEVGLSGGASGPMVTAPVPWMLAVMRAHALAPSGLRKTLPRTMKGAGQMPMDAPNVGGWPSGTAWLSSSVTLARFDFASTVARVADPTTVPKQAAAKGDYDALADALGRPSGFGATTRAALASLRASAGPPEVGRLAIAIAAPELAVG